MGKLRLVDGGQGRTDGDAAPKARPIIDDGGDENTVVGVPDFVLQEMTAQNAARMFDDSAVEVALGQIVESDSVEVDLRGEINTPLPVPVPQPPPQQQPFAPPPGYVMVPIYAPPSGGPPIAPSYVYGAPATGPVPLQQMPLTGAFPLQPGMPNTGPFPLQPAMATGPVPRQLPPAPSGEGRSARIVILTVALLAVAGGGVGLGWFLFARDKGEPTAPPPAPVAAVAPTATPKPPAPPPEPAVVKPAEPPPAAPAAKPTPIEIASLAHPTLSQLASPAHGEVVAIAPNLPHEVKAGDRLFTIRSKATNTAKTAALVKRIAELEGMAKDDPGTYEPFLTRARRDLAAAQQADIAVVKATAAGWVEASVKVGQDVKAGEVLGALEDPRTWTAVATVHGDATATWSCAVASADGAHTAACKIVSTETADGGTRVTVEITAATAPWLAGIEQQPQLVLEPPR